MLRKEWGESKGGGGIIGERKNTEAHYLHSSWSNQYNWWRRNCSLLSIQQTAAKGLSVCVCVCACVSIKVLKEQYAWLHTRIRICLYSFWEEIVMEAEVRDGGVPAFMLQRKWYSLKFLVLGLWFSPTALSNNTSRRLEKTDNARFKTTGARHRKIRAVCATTPLGKSLLPKILGLCENNTLDMLDTLSCCFLAVKMRCDVVSSAQSKFSGNTGQISNRMVLQLLSQGFEIKGVHACAFWNGEILAWRKASLRCCLLFHFHVLAKLVWYHTKDAMLPQFKSPFCITCTASQASHLNAYHPIVRCVSVPLYISNGRSFIWKVREMAVSTFSLKWQPQLSLHPKLSNQGCLIMISCHEIRPHGELTLTLLRGDRDEVQFTQTLSFFISPSIPLVPIQLRLNYRLRNKAAANTLSLTFSLTLTCSCWSSTRKELVKISFLVINKFSWHQHVTDCGEVNVTCLLKKKTTLLSAPKITSNLKTTHKHTPNSLPCIPNESDQFNFML